ncbi:hypothetical protein ACHFIV_18600 [Streptomyces sp. ALB3]|uniref:hypothetical protein n=1 Tax=Streptomyces sp. ALB3 TaxID=3374278 RepID=UPI003792F187
MTRAGRTRYTYDEQGRVTLRRTRTLSGTVLAWHFQWDAEDRLTDVRTPQGARWRYLYDPLGRRLAKQRLAADHRIAETTTYRWDGALLAEERTGGTALVWHYTACSVPAVPAWSWPCRWATAAACVRVHRRGSGGATGGRRRRPASQDRRTFPSGHRARSARRARHRELLAGDSPRRTSPRDTAHPAENWGSLSCPSNVYEEYRGTAAAGRRVPFGAQDWAGFYTHEWHHGVVDQVGPQLSCLAALLPVHFSESSSPYSRGELNARPSWADGIRRITGVGRLVPHGASLSHSSDFSTVSVKETIRRFMASASS